MNDERMRRAHVPRPVDGKLARRVVVAAALAVLVAAASLGLLLPMHTSLPGNSHAVAFTSPTISLQKVWHWNGANVAYAFQYGFTSVPTPIDLVSANITLKNSGGTVLQNNNWYELTIINSGGTVLCAESFAAGSSEGVLQTGSHSTCTTASGTSLGFAEVGQAANTVYSYGVDTGSSGGFTIVLPSSWANYNTQAGQMPNSFECGWTNPVGWD